MAIHLICIYRFSDFKNLAKCTFDKYFNIPCHFKDLKFKFNRKELELLNCKDILYIHSLIGQIFIELLLCLRCLETVKNMPSSFMKLADL